MPTRSYRSRLGSHLVGGFLLFAGLSLMWLGAWALFYGMPASETDASCRTLCSLFQLAGTALGPLAGQMVAGSLTFAAGLAFALVGRYLYDADKAA